MHCSELCSGRVGGRKGGRRTLFGGCGEGESVGKRDHSEKQLERIWWEQLGWRMGGGLE